MVEVTQQRYGTHACMCISIYAAWHQPYSILYFCICFVTFIFFPELWNKILDDPHSTSDHCQMTIKSLPVYLSHVPIPAHYENPHLIQWCSPLVQLWLTPCWMLTEEEEEEGLVQLFLFLLQFWFEQMFGDSRLSSEVDLFLPWVPFGDFSEIPWWGRKPNPVPLTWHCLYSCWLSMTSLLPSGLPWVHYWIGITWLL